MVLTSVISSTKAEVMTCLDSFTQFHSVWDEDKEKAVAVSTLQKHFSFKWAVFVNNDSSASSFAMGFEKLLVNSNEEENSILRVKQICLPSVTFIEEG